MHNNGTLAAARNSLPALGVDPHPSPPAGGSIVGVAAPSASAAAAASSSSDKSPTRLEGNSSRSGVHSHSSTHSMLSTPRDETADSDDERDAHGAAAASAASAETIPSALSHAPLHDRSATPPQAEEATHAAPAAAAAPVVPCDIDDIIARLQSTRIGSGGADASVSGGGHVADCAAAPKVADHAHHAMGSHAVLVLSMWRAMSFSHRRQRRCAIHSRTNGYDDACNSRVSTGRRFAARRHNGPCPFRVLRLTSVFLLLCSFPSRSRTRLSRRRR